jgi:hypothetical protein
VDDVKSYDDELRSPLIVLVERNREKPGFPCFTGTSEGAIDRSDDGEQRNHLTAQEYEEP